MLIDGAVVFQETFSNVGNPQSYLGYNPGSVQLQIVPVLTGMSGRPGLDAQFDLFGSGFMDGASTLRVGGVVQTDDYASNLHGDAFGTRNGTYRFWSRFSTEGPLRLDTPGGWHQIAAPSFAQPAFVQFDSILSTAAAGTPAGAAAASANAGQDIVLVGQGFSTSTLVQFTAADSTGVTGTLTRSGTPSQNGTRLTVRVPALRARARCELSATTIRRFRWRSSPRCGRWEARWPAATRSCWKGRALRPATWWSRSTAGKWAAR